MSEIQKRLYEKFSSDAVYDHSALSVRCRGADATQMREIAAALFRGEGITAEADYAASYLGVLNPCWLEAGMATALARDQDVDFRLISTEKPFRVTWIDIWIQPDGTIHEYDKESAAEAHEDDFCEVYNEITFAPRGKLVRESKRRALQQDIKADNVE